MKRLVIAAATLVLTLTGCSSADADPPAETTQAASSDLLADYGLAEMNASEAIDHLDRIKVANRPTDLLASVEPDQLVLTDEEQEVTLDMPDDSTYISIAPYENQSHECFYHSLTTCQGELANERVTVQITDDSTGDVIVDEKATTYDNGFVGFWVPRNLEGTIEISHDGMVGTTDFSTSDDGATCITDLQVA
ncbi:MULTISPECIES: CueP family metal-binding protein [Brevibacterium]|uniref:CueP family metal-binding protein n=1 Tax=Brevibacterium aurantiacum TaxID=273384 RepID=A0A2A3ZM88_BREAU|nr:MULTISPECIES: CueP family metal-binding protein [Brevibacterium]MDN5551234.1 CueP family metal-binding protein [Brevibacterium sp.]PCC52709.1 hypothetical protein CIK59_15185 [Brevibacterium aurantiacum]WCE40693.1 CueP family metal-binding protein [Brevibacterium sp. BDJS002]